MKPPLIPGLSHSPDVRESRSSGKSSARPATLNDNLARAVDEKTSSKGSEKRHAARQSKHRSSSADHREKSRDVSFTGDDSPFHLWYPAKLRLGDGGEYESAGHYLVMKSLGRCFYNV